MFLDRTVRYSIVVGIQILLACMFLAITAFAGAVVVRG